MKIIQISDIHVTSPNYHPGWGDKVVEIVNSERPELLVISGDLTNEGHIHEYEEWAQYFSRFKVAAAILVPGNHDARNDGWQLFEEMVGPRLPSWENAEVVVQGLDSSEPDIDAGAVGRENYQLLRDRMSVKGKIKIVILHHHLIPIPGTGRERQIPTDAGDVLELLRECGIHIVLSGHKHRAWAWNLDGMHLITCGTSASRRLKGRGHPSLMIYEIKGTKFKGIEVNVADGSRTTKIDAVLGIP